MLTASIRVGLAHGNGMLFNDTITALMMKMAVVKEIDMITMLNRSMATAVAVLMIVIWMGFAIVFAHDI